ncbi:hypothetical protein QBC44DRAFT_52557 [Cladorrhinum sp. PSN332]|nr:hypothetical protein QBC44DRAFT_52557 [Cladorrhinum sp. PSN332]
MTFSPLLPSSKEEEERAEGSGAGAGVQQLTLQAMDMVENYGQAAMVLSLLSIHLHLRVLHQLLRILRLQNFRDGVVHGRQGFTFCVCDFSWGVFFFFFRVLVFYGYGVNTAYDIVC